MLQAGAAGGQKIDVGYLPTTDAPPKPANATVGHNPVNGYTLDPLYSWAINYFPLNYQSTTGNGPIIKQLYFREALQLMMNQAAVISGPLHGYGQFTVGPVGTYPPNPYLSSQGKAGDPFPYNPAKAKQLLTSNGWTVVPNGATTCTDPAKCGAGRQAGPGAVVHPAVRDGHHLDRAGDDAAAVQRLADRHQAVPGAEAVQPDHRPGGGNCVVAHISCNWDMGNWGGGWMFVPDYYPSARRCSCRLRGANSAGYNNAQNDSLINETLTNASMEPLYTLAGLPAKQLPEIWQPNGVYELTEIASNLQGVIPQSTDAQPQPGELVLHQ